jgi:hypothetical protein
LSIDKRYSFLTENRRYTKYGTLNGQLAKVKALMRNSIKVLFVSLILAVFSIGAYAQTNKSIAAIIPIISNLLGLGGKCVGWCGGHHDKKFVFVTSTTYSGNLVQEAKNVTKKTYTDGLAAADALCQSSANAADLSGSYMAWLATDSMAEPSDRFSDNAGPFHRKDETLVASSKATLASRIITAPINQTEYGDPPPISVVWTGIPRDYANGPQTCESWSTDYYLRAAGMGWTGVEYINTKWTQSGGAIKCNLSIAIYCFEK